DRNAESYSIIDCDYAYLNTVNTTASLHDDVPISATGIDLSGLRDGTITTSVTATDNNGNSLSANDTDTKDAVEGSLTVATEITEAVAEVSGTSADVKAGTILTITFTDADGVTVRTTAEVRANVSYSATGIDLSGLRNGTITT